MAITKKLIHFNQFSNFNVQKLSANRENTTYTIGVGGAVTTGEPYILYHSIVFIKDVLKIWTHGSLYDCGETDLSDYLTADEIAEVYATVEALNGKQDKITDLETIRSGAALGATALQAVPDEYVTETELTGKGYATTSSVNTELAKKVDKVSGKGLSTNDFTTVLKTKLEGLSNYDDTEISGAIETLRGDFDALVSGDTTTAIKTFNEVIAFLDGISDSEDLDSIIAGIEQQIAAKQDIITDLETIRSGAALGATALQSYTEQYTGTYSKPSGGIPKTDLDSAVQTSLGKADTALQSYTETDPVFKASAAAGITSSDITSWNGKQDKVLKFENVTASNWVSDSTYSDFGYHCDLTCTGATGAMFAEVVFSQADAVSGDYAMVCETMTNVVRIYSKKNVSTTVPTIIIHK